MMALVTIQAQIPHNAPTAMLMMYKKPEKYDVWSAWGASCSAVSALSLDTKQCLCIVSKCVCLLSDVQNPLTSL